MLAGGGWGGGSCLLCAFSNVRGWHVRIDVFPVYARLLEDSKPYRGVFPRRRTRLDVGDAFIVLLITTPFCVFVFV